jgi:catechol 2,3-dioxygenase-like lactoylglutathione lyase family enzyme
MDALGVDNVLVAVGDLDEARRFYGELLGLPLKVRVRGDPAGGLSHRW